VTLPAKVEIALRPVRPDDYGFAVALYVEGSKDHLAKIGRWDEARVLAAFRRGYKREQARIIRAGGEDVGWVQIVEFAHRLHLRQIHIVEPFRNRGIGTRLIGSLMRRASRLGKRVTLDVIHGNPAKNLYLRLGFSFVGEDQDKLHMTWAPSGASKNKMDRVGRDD
jgi:ribosomal protein S18 acetylase RimI-like enzyme